VRREPVIHGCVLSLLGSHGYPEVGVSDKIRVLVTGSRLDTLPDPDAARRVVRQALAKHIPYQERHRYVVVHGGCDGVDQFADDWARDLGVEVEPHAVEKDDRGRWVGGKGAGPRRNQEMVDLGAAVCLAFPFGVSRGTRDCMARARKAGIPVITYELGPKPAPKPTRLDRELYELEQTDPDVRKAREAYDKMVERVTSGRDDITRKVWGDDA
jgi:hypothetical protein